MSTQAVYLRLITLIVFNILIIDHDDDDEDHDDDDNHCYSRFCSLVTAETPWLDQKCVYIFIIIKIHIITIIKISIVIIR